MYPRAGESIITRTVCPQSNMEMVLSCRPEHHVQDNLCQQFVHTGNIVLREIQSRPGQLEIIVFVCFSVFPLSPVPLSPVSSQLIR